MHSGPRFSSKPQNHTNHTFPPSFWPLSAHDKWSFKSCEKSFLFIISTRLCIFLDTKSPWLVSFAQRTNCALSRLSSTKQFTQNPFSSIPFARTGDLECLSAQQSIHLLAYRPPPAQDGKNFPSYRKSWFYWALGYVPGSVTHSLHSLPWLKTSGDGWWKEHRRRKEEWRSSSSCTEMDQRHCWAPDPLTACTSLLPPWPGTELLLLPGNLELRS